MGETVADFVGVSHRFARSVRLDAPESTELIDGYRPTARALEIIRRVARGMSMESGTRAFSIIGPYGSGKSSFAVFLDTLLGPKDGRGAAERLLIETDEKIAMDLADARRAWEAARKGMVRAVVTAPQRRAGHNYGATCAAPGRGEVRPRKRSTYAVRACEPCRGPWLSRAES